MRLFFAINFSQEFKERFYSISKDFQTFHEPIKYEPIEKLHLTLLFLGEVNESLITIINEKVKPLTEIFSFEKILFDKVGVFKNFKQPRILWIGAEENLELKNLSEELKLIAHELNITIDEKDFHPHITIGRIKGLLSREFIEFIKSYKFEPFSVVIESFQLMESRLDRSGSKYYIQESYKFKEIKLCQMKEMKNSSS